MMKGLTILILLLALSGAYAHTDKTGELDHDQNETHFAESINNESPSAPQYTAQKEVASWENAWPFVLLLFLGLGGFAFAMGMILHPHGSTKRKR